MLNKFNSVDAYGQEKVIKVLKDIFSRNNPRFIQHIEDNGRVDIEMYVTDKNGNEVKYAIECKDRYMPDWRYNSYIIEDGKIDALTTYSADGYKPLYINTFSNDMMYVWDISNIEYDMIYGKEYHYKTVEESGTYRKDKKMVRKEDAVWVGKMK